MLRKQQNFDFLEFLADGAGENGNGNGERLPSLTDLSREKGVSISVLREQLQVARALGLVEVRPRTGIRRLPYTFTPAVRESLLYAVARDRSRFDQYADLRRHVERAYWQEAVACLRPEDHTRLRQLVDQAWEKLHGDPIRLPHQEHRQLHLTIYGRLQNPFVVGILEAYWEAYEEVGLSRYEGLAYLEQVWEHHRLIVDCIENGDLERGFRALNEHFDLIDKRPE